MNIQNIHPYNRQNQYKPSFEAKFIKTDHMLELVKECGKNANQDREIKRHVQYLATVFPDVELEFSKMITNNGKIIPVIKNLKNECITSGFDLMKKGMEDFTELSLSLFQKINNPISQEHFDLFLRKGIRARNESRAILSRLRPVKVPKTIQELGLPNYGGYIIDEGCEKLLEKFEQTASFKYKNSILIKGRNESGYLRIREAKKNNKPNGYIFSKVDNDKNESEQMFRITRKPNGFTFKYDESLISKEEVYDILNEYLPKYFKLVEKSKKALGQN